MIEQPIGSGILYVLSNVQAQHEEAFTRWCNETHHFETMEVDGFLSLRRFDRILTNGTEPFRLLTLYQLATPEAAAGESYHKHSETYTPIPPGVLDGLSFGRAILRAVSPPITQRPEDVPAPKDRQLIGSAVVSVLVQSPPAQDVERWMVNVVAPRVVALDGVLGARAFAAVEDNDILRYLLQVEIVDSASAEDLSALVSGLAPPAAVMSLECAAYQQSFPPAGTLLRDRRFATTV